MHIALLILELRSSHTVLSNVNFDLGFMSFVGNCKFNYFATQMTTHENA